MATIVTTEEEFRHSYSREFGWEINENNPERKIIRYKVYLNGAWTDSYIEKNFPSGKYHALYRTGRKSYIEICDSMAAAKKFISETHESVIGV